MKIEIAADHTEAAAFAQWLRSCGHDASVGRTTGSYVDGVWASADPDASEALRALWEAYCEASQ